MGPGSTVDTGSALGTGSSEAEPLEAETPEAVTSVALREHILVGRIVRPHGVHGELSVASLSENEARFGAGSRLLLLDETGERVARSVEIASSRRHKDRVLLRLEDVADRDAAEQLRGRLLAVDEDDVPAPADGSYYFFDLIGCRLLDRGGSGDVGRVVDVVEDGGGLLLEVREGERTLLVPFVRDFGFEVDLKEQSIRCELPEGLIESCASTS